MNQKDVMFHVEHPLLCTSIRQSSSNICYKIMRNINFTNKKKVYTIPLPWYLTIFTPHFFCIWIIL